MSEGTPVKPPHAEALLTVEDLRTHFDTDGGRARAVDGISFSIESGETVGIVGESGCGKTVASLSIMGLVPDPGRIQPGSSIRLRGRELVGRPSRELRRVRGSEIAMIFQEPMSSLNPVFTVGNQMVEALTAHGRHKGREAAEAGVQLLREVGIPEPERRCRDYPHHLSGGMRQRVMIAMALAGEPGLLIADEPTTALDVTVQAQILDLLARLRERHGMAILLISHDLGVVAEVCDRVLVMYAGQIVETGTTHEIFTGPRHPYTEGLLRSLPKIGAERTRLRPIPGTVPRPTSWPSACRFRDRCSYAWKRCALEAPPLIAPDPPPASRTSRCWLEEEPERRVDVLGAEEVI